LQAAAREKFVAFRRQSQVLSNRDIGFVHAGQAAEVKVDTFSFTR
jgi:hypothetical protein